MNNFDYDQVNIKILKYRNLTNRMNEELNTLNDIFKLIHNGSLWSGVAHDYFDESFYKLVNASDDLLTAMNNIDLYLQKIYDNYRKFEEVISLQLEG